MSNEMYYPRFTKVIIHHFMSKDPSILRRNKINWHYVRDDSIFSTIKVVSRYQNTQQYDAMLPIELINDEIRNTKAYKEYYAFATGEAAPKPKASARKKRSGSDTSIAPLIATTTPKTTVAVTPKLTAVAKGKQPAKAKSLSDPSEVARTEAQQLKIVLRRSRQQMHISQPGGLGADDQEKVGDDDEGDEGHDHEEGEEDDDEEDKDGGSEDEGDGKEDQSLKISEEERLNEEEEADELYRDVDINQGRGLQVIQEVEDFHVTLTSINSDGQLKSLEASFSEYRQTTPFAEAVSNIPSIVHQHINQQMTEAALVDAYEADKIILDSYEEIVILKRRRDDDDDQDEGPSARSDRGSKRQREGKEPESVSAPLETATRSTGRSTTRFKSRQASASAKDQPIVQSSQHPEWFSQLKKPPTPDHDWNKTLPAGLCTSLIELEYHLEGVYKATTDQLDWVNPEGQQYPHNMLQPLPLIPNNRGCRVIPFAHFINNDLKYLRGCAFSRKYTTSVPIDYDKHALWGVSHWGRKHQQFYGFVVNRESALDVYSKRRIIAITDLKIVEWHSYKHLDWITVRRDDDKLYKFKEGDFKRLRLQDIEDMLLLLVQGKLTNLTVKEHFAFNGSLRIFTRSIVIQRRVEDLQLG
nr:hypothetical protein [Tanacetum cinerariifolium]